MAALPENVHVFDDGEAVAQAAAAALREIVANSPRERIAVCLSGGSTPKRIYRLLLDPNYRERIPWDRVHWFWGDERFVSMRDERSNAGMAWAAFLADAPVDRAVLARIGDLQRRLGQCVAAPVEQAQTA